MRMSFSLLAASFLAVFVPAATALDITGTVVDKLDHPINLAKVCLKSDPNTCVNSDALGQFHIADGMGVRRIDGRNEGYALEFLRGGISLAAPATGAAVLDWIDARGNRIFKPQNLDLSAGRNMVGLPGSLPRDGLYFLRLSTGNFTVTWKAALMGRAFPDGSAPGFASESGGSGEGASVMALSKTSAFIKALTVSKAGYRTKNYQPKADVETGVMIALAASDDALVNFSGNYSAKVISIDRTKKETVTETVSASCDSGKVVKDTARDTSSYSIRNGQLYLWTKGDCTGQLMTGTSTDPVGTWTLVDQSAELPADLKSPNCATDTTSSDVPFENFNAVYNFTETQVTGNVSFDFCPGDIYAPLFSFLFAQDSTIKMTKNTCQQAVFTNKTADPGTLNMTKKGDSLNISFSYKTTTCAFSQNFQPFNQNPTCPAQDNTLKFLACITGSGFVDSTAHGLGKVSAQPVGAIRMPMSMEKWQPASHAAAFRSVGSIFSLHGWRFESR